LANLTFTYLEDYNIFRDNTVPSLYVVENKPIKLPYDNYFPEYHLIKFFKEKLNLDISINTIARLGFKQDFAAYQKIVNLHNIDTVILVDGGTDSLMRGDEASLGTPEEDATSIAAVSSLTIPRKFLCCVGFGVDSHHGVSHALFLENVADIIRQGGYLGTFSLLQEMPEIKVYSDAVKYVTSNMSQSIVCGSVLAAIEGKFGDNHTYTETRTRNSRLFINPLMSLFWCFELDCVAKK